MPERLPRVLDALRDSGRKVVRQQRGYVAQCPAHADREPSLSLTETPDGVVLFKCHAGCLQEEVLAALKGLGVQPGDLAEPKVPRDPNAPEAVYDYLGPDGELVFQVVRLPDKRFRQRRPDGRGGWHNNLDGVGRPFPYRLPEVIEAVEAGAPVYVCEGEKDADALRAHAGVTATCNAGGAGGWLPRYSQWLAGATVYVWADNDRAGLKHAAQVRAMVEPVAAEVHVITGAMGKDAADHIAAGYGLADVLPMPEDRLPDPEAPVEPEADWTLSSAADVEQRNVDWLWRDLLPLGALSLLGGHSGTSKSTLIAWLAARVTRGQLPGDLTEPGTVLVLSTEDAWENTVAPRLEAAGADLGRVVFPVFDRGHPRLEFPRDHDSGRFERMVKDAAARGGAPVRLVVMDPVVSFFPGQANDASNVEVRATLATLAEAARTGGYNLLGVQHLNKGGGGAAPERLAGSFAFGAQARTVVLMGAHPAEPDRQRFVALAKSNLSAVPPATRFDLREVTTSKGVAVTCLANPQPDHSVTAEDATKRPERDGCELYVACEALGELLADGPLPVARIFSALEQLDVTSKMAKQAKVRLGVRARAVTGQHGFKEWTWELPPRSELVNGFTSAYETAPAGGSFATESEQEQASEQVASEGTGRQAAAPQGDRVQENANGEHVSSKKETNNPECFVSLVQAPESSLEDSGFEPFVKEPNKERTTNKETSTKSFSSFFLSAADAELSVGVTQNGCEHAWRPWGEHEQACTSCGVIEPSTSADVPEVEL